MDGHGHVVLNFYRKYWKQHFLGVGGGEAKEWCFLAELRVGGDVIPFSLTWGVQHETPPLLIVKSFRATKERR